MSYVPDADLVTEPVSGRMAGSAAAEFRTMKTRLKRVVRVPETEPELAELPPAAERANKVLAFNALGQLIATIPIDGDIGTIVADLANATDDSLGAGMSGYGYLKNYVARTSGWKLNNLGLTVDDFKYLDDGTMLSDAQAIQAAVDHLESLIGTAPFGDRGGAVLFTPRQYDVDETTTITKTGISFTSQGGPRTSVIMASVPVFDFGDYTDTIRVRAGTIKDLDIVATNVTNTDAAITLYRTTGFILKDTYLVNWYIGVDAYRAANSIITDNTSSASTRTTAALAVIRMQGTDETDTTGETYSPGGGWHIEDNEWNGSNSTVDTAFCYLVKSVDGLYEFFSHAVGFAETWGFYPDGSPENHVIISVRIHNFYVDEPSMFAANPNGISIKGTVKQHIVFADATTGSSVYKRIQIIGGEIRGAYEANYCIEVAVTDGDDWWDDPSHKLSEIVIGGGIHITQSRIRGIYMQGASQGNFVEAHANIYSVEFDSNNSIGNAGASDLSVDCESIVVTNCKVGPAAASGSDYIFLIRASDSGASDNPGPTAIVSGNDLSRATVGVAIEHIIVSNVIGSNTLVSDNILPGAGKNITQTTPTITTTDATPTVVWSFTIPVGAMYSFDVKLVGSNASGSKSIAYSWRVSAYRDGGGTTANITALEAYNPTAFGTPPTLTLIGNVVTITAVGIAATSISWNSKVIGLSSR